MSRWVRKPAALASLDLARAAVVEASAGTGKTFFLEHLVAELVLERGASMREIVLVTFTEKAAGELRARVRRLLAAIVTGRDDERVPEAPGWPLDDERLARARRALFELPEAFIGTLHQLCLESLRDVDPTFAAGVHVMDEPIEEAWRHVIRRAILEDDFGEAWTRSDRKLRKHVEEGTRLLVRTRAPFRPSMAELEQQALELFDLWLETGAPVAGDGMHPYTDDSLFGKARAMQKPAVAYRSWLAHLTSSLEAFRRREGAPPSSLLLSLLPAWTAREDTAKRIDDGIRALEKRDEHAAAEVLRRGRYLTGHARSYTMALLGGRLKEAITALHARRGTLSFDEMTARFRDALAAEANQPARPIARDLRRRFRYVLVDEFQDTDDVQWEALRRAFLDECAHPPSTVVVVGDPKQAIYRFRGADVEAYQEAKALLLDERAKPAQLSDSYRSTPALIDALNALLPSRLFVPEDRVELPLITARAKTRFKLPRGERALTLLGAPTPDAPYDRASLDRVFARGVAQEIEALLADDTPRFTDGKGSRPRRLVAGDICVLGRSKNDLDVIGRALRRRGVPFVHYKRRGLYQTAEALDLLDVLLAAAEPSSSNQMRALATAFFPIAAPELEAYAELDEEHPCRRALAAWHELAREGDVPGLLRSLERQVPVMERLLFHEGERAATNLRQLLDELLALHAREGYQLPFLIDELRRRIADDAAKSEAVETDLLQLESERSLVTLMTMHAAKGLEYPVVFLAGGYRGTKQSPPKGKPTVLHEDGQSFVALDPRDFGKQWQAEEEAEDARLLYVALTRAQARLYLPHWWPGDTRAHPVLYARLKERLDEVAAAGGDALIGHRVVQPLPTERPRIPGEVSDETVARVRSWRPEREAPRALTSDERRRLRAAREPVRVDSFSSLKRELEARTPSEAEEADRPGPEGHERHEPEPAVPVEERELETTFPGGRVVGDLVHQILERIDRRRVAKLASPSALLEAEAAAFERLGRIGFDDDAVLGVARAVYAALRAPLVAGDVRYPPVSEIAEQLVEEEFLLPHVVERAPGARGYLTGSIDLIFRHEGRTCLADWKTNVLRTQGRLDYSPARVAEETWSAYALQLKLYTVALLRWLAVEDEAAYERRFGGVFYLYLRGMRANGDGGHGVFFHRPTYAEARAYVDEVARVAKGAVDTPPTRPEEVPA